MSITPQSSPAEMRDYILGAWNEAMTGPGLLMDSHQPVSARDELAALIRDFILAEQWGDDCVTPDSLPPRSAS